VVHSTHLATITQLQLHMQCTIILRIFISACFVRICNILMLVAYFFTNLNHIWHIIHNLAQNRNSRLVETLAPVFVANFWSTCHLFHARSVWLWLCDRQLEQTRSTCLLASFVHGQRSVPKCGVDSSALLHTRLSIPVYVHGPQCTSETLS